MSVAAIVPMRHSSERVVGKNYRPLAGRPLYHHIVQTLLEVPEIDTVVVDTDSPTILDDARAHFPDVVLLERPEHLRDGNIPMNDVLANSVKSISESTILQTHSTNPFLTAATLSAALGRYADPDKTFDSLFSVTRLQARLWDAQGQPVNHDPSVLLRTQDLAPLFVENTCFYIFEKAQLLALGNRLGASPATHEVWPMEAIDIDEESDFELAIAVAEMQAAR